MLKRFFPGQGLHNYSGFRAMDVADFVKIGNSELLTEENRAIMVYRKGRKDGLNRDTIFFLFKEGSCPNFKLKAPMLCSLSKELSACVMCSAAGGK
ncbi:MAG: hypothetical protein HQ557_18085 [Bacteroidetes bacterium]|nr:hypothetical protein [Bacteroidota bacterium]